VQLNIAVLVKFVPPTEASLKISTDRRLIDPSDINFVLNPYDEYAVEEALRIKEKLGGTVIAVSLGGDEAGKAIRQALAMGADEGLQVLPSGGYDMLGTAKALAAALNGKGFELILAGKQAVDDDCGAIGSMVAEFLDIPHVANVVKLTLDGGKADAEREFEGGVECFSAPLPLLITAQKGLNEPRYPSLKGIMTAKKKTINTFQAKPDQPKTRIVELKYPPVRPAGKIVGEGADAVPELVRLLKEEAKVI